MLKAKYTYCNYCDMLCGVKVKWLKSNKILENIKFIDHNIRLQFVSEKLIGRIRCFVI